MVFLNEGVLLTEPPKWQAKMGEWTKVMMLEEYSRDMKVRVMMLKECLCDMIGCNQGLIPPWGNRSVGVCSWEASYFDRGNW